LVLFFKKERLAFYGFTPFSAAQPYVNFKSGQYEMALLSLFWRAISPPH